MPMTSDAKRALSTTIRALRARLLDDLHAATEATYRLSLRARDAGLDEVTRIRRERLDAWISEQVRAQAAGQGTGARSEEDFRREAEKQAAYTLLNRLVLLRLMEAPGPAGEPLRTPAVVTGGWESRAYLDFRGLAPALVRGDATEGYAFLLQLVFEDLATELPGLYGPAGAADLVPVPAALLRHVVEELDRAELESCWTDDMTLGWVYQYWNDPEREALDAKLNAGGKVEPHEIASKTQMFTERYMVDWLLQNSLGPMWLAMCRKHGWTPEVQADGTLGRLEERRVEWRRQRDASEVSLTELMPLHTDAERRWAYYVPQPIPDDAVEQASDSVRDLKILDPAVGSGHFLVVALDLLVALYREEARQRGAAGQPEWSDRAIVERILSYNLHGIDLDPRAVQIAAAALWLKAGQIAPDARPERMNLVASNLSLASLPEDDPALVELRREVERETGIPGALTDTIVHALRGADHLGSLLKVDAAVDAAILEHEQRVAVASESTQVDMFRVAPARQGALDFEASAARRSLIDRLEDFLSEHTGGDDLGLRLRGQQLAAGVRFVRAAREGAYDLVVANPPYQGTSKMAESKYVQRHYRLGKADLYVAFLLRGLELVRGGGVSAMLTMRNWMFIKQFSELRSHLLEAYDLRALGDFDCGAFEEIAAGPGGVSVAASAWQRTATTNACVAIRPSKIGSVAHDVQQKRAATLCHTRRYDFEHQRLQAVPERPLVYWWGSRQIEYYGEYPTFGEAAEVRVGTQTSNNTRFIRRPSEVSFSGVWLERLPYGHSGDRWKRCYRWYPYIKGGAGRTWIEPLADIALWESFGLQARLFAAHLYGSHTRIVKNEDYYFRHGVAFTKIGRYPAARLHRYASVFDVAGSSVFPADPQAICCLMNAVHTRRILADLNPTVNFQVGDVNRLPLLPMERAEGIFGNAERVLIRNTGCSPDRAGGKRALVLAAVNSGGNEGDGLCN